MVITVKPWSENIFEQLNTCNLIKTMKIMVMPIHNVACNQQMSVNDDKQYTERLTTAMCIHNLACNQQMSVNDDK